MLKALIGLAVVMYAASFLAWNAPFWAAAGFAALLLMKPEWMER